MLNKPGWFARLAKRALQWARHPHAPYYLAGMSFVEASFFPIPPDVMLAPMSLAKPQYAWRYAALATVFSVLGGLLGYSIGFLLLHMIHPFLVQLGYATSYQQVLEWFQMWGVWIVLIAGFTPIPYKLFTIASGALHLSLLPFIIASILGRAARFFLVSWVMAIGGERMELLLYRYIDRLTWLIIAVFLIVIGWHYL
ncbi:MAG: YqaA family protein [Gammaproteobacteria bacterium]